MKYIQIRRASDGFIVTLPVDRMIVTPYDPAVESHSIPGVKAYYAEITFVGDENFQLITDESARCIVERLQAVYYSTDREPIYFLKN